MAIGAQLNRQSIRHISMTMVCRNRIGVHYTESTKARQQHQPPERMILLWKVNIFRMTSLSQFIAQSNRMAPLDNVIIVGEGCWWYVDGSSQYRVQIMGLNFNQIILRLR